MASEPLISNEQFGNAGSMVCAVIARRAVWRLGVADYAEQKTPPLVVGLAYGNSPLALRGPFSWIMAKLLFGIPARARAPRRLGTGLGCRGLHWVEWEFRFLFGWPLI